MTSLGGPIDGRFQVQSIPMSQQVYLSNKILGIQLRLINN